jgi:hypothetical protein
LRILAVQELTQERLDSKSDVDKEIADCLQKMYEAVSKGELVIPELTPANIRKLQSECPSLCKFQNLLRLISTVEVSL